MTASPTCNMAQAYSTLPQDHEELLSAPDSENEEFSILGSHKQRSGKPFSLRIPTLLHWIAHGVTIVLLVVIVLRPSTIESCSSTLDRTEEIYAPAYGDESQKRHFEIFKTAFWEKTPYKGPPTPEIVARWNHLTETPPLNLTATEISRLGLSTDSVQYPQSAGGGYIGYLESSHQLHCLQNIWARHHFDKHPELFPHIAEKLSTMPDIEAAHFEHCVDVIRQRLMCTADASMVTFRWVKKLSTPYPNFHTTHMCGDYEGLLQWGEGRKADLEKVEGWDWHAGPRDVELDHLP